MKRLVIGGIAALAIGLAGAPVAGADPDAHPMLTANDRAFIKATDRVIVMYSGDDPDFAGRWVGYPGVPAQLRINTAHTVCSTLDTGIFGQEISDMIVTAFDDRHDSNHYLAAWFTNDAISYYCMRHSDKLSNI